MSKIFEKWDKEIDIKGLLEDIDKAENDYEEIPYGRYEVEITKMELTSTKKGDPMVSVWFKILEGKHKGSLIFYNQVVSQGFQIKMIMKFLETLGTDLESTFKSYSQFNELIMDMMEIIKDKLEYVLDYGENKKGYKTFVIEDVFDV